MKNHFRALIDLPAIILCGWLLTLPVAVRAAEATHPLDALNEAEISSAVKLLQAAPNFPPTALFSTVVLHEPPKAEVLAFKKGAKFRREAFVIVLDREKNRTYEAVVNLRANQILSWKEIAGVQPLVFAEEYEVLPYIAPDAMVRKRAGFINNHLWATKYNALEMNSAGVYPNQSKGGDGLPQFVANDEVIENQDVVVWYTLGVTHIPRPEEWAVMPVTHVGFKLIPGGFFARNPAPDVPK